MNRIVAQLLGEPIYEVISDKDWVLPFRQAGYTLARTGRSAEEFRFVKNYKNQPQMRGTSGPGIPWWGVVIVPANNFWVVRVHFQNRWQNAAQATASSIPEAVQLGDQAISIMQGVE